MGRRVDERLSRVVHVACGTEHSIAIDDGGVVWTWGAGGRACLGHGETGYGAPNEGMAIKADAQAREMGLTAVGRQEALVMRESTTTLVLWNLQFS